MKTRYLSKPFFCEANSEEIAATLVALETHFKEALHSFTTMPHADGTFFSVYPEFDGKQAYAVIMSAPLPKGLIARMEAFEKGFRTGYKFEI